MRIDKEINMTHANRNKLFHQRNKAIKAKEKTEEAPFGSCAMFSLTKLINVKQSSFAIFITIIILASAFAYLFFSSLPQILLSKTRCKKCIFRSYIIDMVEHLLVKKTLLKCVVYFIRRPIQSNRSVESLS